MDCAHIIHTRYGDFSARLHENVKNLNIPAAGSIELTSRCNLNCIHCYINQPAGDCKAKEHELTAAQWMSLIDQMADEGCLWLLITGGEPLVRQDFFNIYTYTKKKGMLVSLFTNGTTITEKIADRLAEWTPFVVEITLYGHTQETYERVTGVPGSHKRCYQAIDALLKRQIPLQLKSMVLTGNQHEIRDMQKFARDRGLSFRYDPMVNKRFDGSDFPESCRLTPGEIVAFENEDEERQAAWLDIWNRLGEVRVSEDQLFTCGAGQNDFHIDPAGVLYLCIMARHSGYDLMRGSFHEGWVNFIPRVYDRKRLKENPCAGCDIKALCDHCPGWADVETGDVEGHVPYLCETTRLRAARLGIIKNSETNTEQKAGFRILKTMKEK